MLDGLGSGRFAHGRIPGRERLARFQTLARADAICRSNASNFAGSLPRMRLLAPLALTFLASACNPYRNNAASVRDASHLPIYDYGAPDGFMVSRPVACPPGTQDGDIQLAWDSGAKQIRGRCQGGVMVGEWKAWYANGEDRWLAMFAGGKLVGEFEGWYPR
jgi:hypothetical protein